MFQVEFILAVCRSSNDCLVGEKCVDSKCQISCVGHSQCQQGQACVNNVCILGCRSNRDCPSEHACLSNKCLGLSQLHYIIYYIFMRI